ncbi:sugar ABC transporter permease [Paenibacillus alkaliterrae]|uniref:carbohydrate ABC transporter permease n=1 Tax=Paenibacillus alkaliterrae TaxID=320909 RepID=UPI001F388FE7|nr:sugar ABC transporter permease [Paenibacillus alkaliterrae]MCF2938440.1 sugar ABC transporter permease [Paenibacillus alkaliterrae]
MKTDSKLARGALEPSSGARGLLWPGIIMVGIITQLPFLYTIYLSLHDWNLMRPDLGVTFAGLSNFGQILSEPAFWEVLKNTFFLTVFCLLLCLAAGMGLALLLNRDFFGKGIIRTLFVSPFFIMPAVSGIVWKTVILNPNFGFSAYITGKLGLPAIDWLGKYPLETIIIVVAWQWIPFFMLVLLAGLQSVSPDLMEASMLDGANRFQQFFNVTIPHLLRYIEVALLLGLIFIMQTFGEIYVTTSGGPGYSSTNLPFYLYRLGFQSWDVGGASALGVLIVIIMTIFMTILFKIMRKTFGGELS